MGGRLPGGGGLTALKGGKEEREQQERHGALPLHQLPGSEVIAMIFSSNY